MAHEAEDSSGDHHDGALGNPNPNPNPHSLSPAAQTRFVEEPEDQTVVAGQRIVLSCVVLNYSGIVQWTKDGLALGMGQGLKGNGAGMALQRKLFTLGLLQCFITLFPRVRCCSLHLPPCTEIPMWLGS